MPSARTKAPCIVCPQAEHVLLRWDQQCIASDGWAGTREERVTYVDVTLLTDVAVGGGRFGACELLEPE